MIFRKTKKDKYENCDRCGSKHNPFGIIGLPYLKMNIHLCHICWLGLLEGLSEDLRSYRNLGEIEFKKLMAQNTLKK